MPLPHVETEHSFKRALREGMNLFLGAGFAVNARTKKTGLRLPVGSALANEIREHFSLTSLSSFSLPKLCTFLKQSKRAALNEYLTKRFSVDPDSLGSYTSLLRISGIRNILTVNIDDIIYELYSRSSTTILNDVTRAGPSIAYLRNVNYYPLHGSVRNPDQGYRFSVEEVISSTDVDPDVWRAVRDAVFAKPTLFWGFGFEDADVIQALYSDLQAVPQTNQRWIQLMEGQEEEAAYFRALGFNILVADTDELLTYLNALAGEHEMLSGSPEVSVAASFRRLFTDLFVPPVSDVPSVGLEGFYGGEAPSWSNIYSTWIPKTTHYWNIVDAIDSGKDVVVSGLVASGKTTLCMQLASEYETPRTKLIALSTLDEATADALLRNIEGNVLLFVDDCTNDARAFNTLLSSSNVQVVGFARDYDYQITSNIISANHVVKDVSELRSQDAQKIIDSIPNTVRKKTTARAPTREKIEKLLDEATGAMFEVLQMNISTTLDKRVEQALSELNKHNSELHDLLTMIAYVRSCRSYVTYDLTHAFLEKGMSPDTALDELDKLGSMTRELGIFSEPIIVTRSRIFAEAVLKYAKNSRVRRMLRKFHRQVSQLRIPDYNVFRRYAFDQRMYAKAFVTPDDGQKEYEYLFKKYGYAQILQQGSLYLLGKNRFKEAFFWSTRAVDMTKKRNFTILNSHAIVRFRANQGPAQTSPTDEGIRQELSEALDQLAYCYEKDNRRTRYHATTFGDLAHDYYRIYWDNEAHSRLVSAERYLGYENYLDPTHRKTRNRLKEIKALLEARSQGTTD